MLNYTQWMILGSGFAAAVTTCRKELFGLCKEDYFPMYLYPPEMCWLHGIQLSCVVNCRENRTVPQCLPVTGACAVNREWERLLISLWVVGQPHAIPATVSLLHFLSTANRGWSICFQSQCKPTDKNRNRQFNQHMTSNSWNYGTCTLLPNSNHPVYRGIYTLMHHHTSTACAFFRALVGHGPHRESPQIHVQ